MRPLEFASQAVTLSYYSITLSPFRVQNILTETGNSKRLVNMTDLVSWFSQEYCIALMVILEFTNCDPTSTFKGIWKIKPIKTIQANQIFSLCLCDLGRHQMGSCKLCTSWFWGLLKCAFEDCIINSKNNVDLIGKNPSWDGCLEKCWYGSD